MKIPGFISYSHDDGSELTEGLAQYLKNLFPNFEPVYDKDVLEGEKLEKIMEKLNLCNILIVVITPATLVSKPVKEEIDFAKEKKMRIIPCKDKFLDKKWGELPWDLQNFKGIEFENGGELKRKTYAALVKILEELSQELQESLPKKTLAEKTAIKAQDTKIIAERGIAGIQTFTLETKKNSYVITGGIDTGEILNILLDRKSLSLIAKINAPANGIMRLLLKCDLINAIKPNGEEDNFIVLIDGKEVQHKEIDLYVDTRTIEVNIPKGTNEVEIIGTQIEGISYIGDVKKGNKVKILLGSASRQITKYLDPDILMIKKGETVRWENNDVASHTITSGNPSDTQTGALFDSSLFASGRSFELTFNEKGTYSYYCQVHPWEIGEIIVE